MSSNNFERLDWPDGDFCVAQNFWSGDEPDSLFARLRDEVAWSQHEITLFGRRIKSPRLSAWYGDADARYGYSGMVYDPIPWIPLLSGIRQTIQTAIGGLPLNGMLANFYRDGGDGMGWHSDNERELGVKPLIVSASFGAVRRFSLKHRHTRRREDLLLNHGSLFVMAGASQQHWLHALPKTTKPCGPRINLTFRSVRPVNAALRRTLADNAG